MTMDDVAPNMFLEIEDLGSVSFCFGDIKRLGQDDGNHSIEQPRYEPEGTFLLYRTGHTILQPRNIRRADSLHNLCHRDGFMSANVYERINVTHDSVMVVSTTPNIFPR